MVHVKICGNTSPTDVRVALNAGADYVGCVIEHPRSPRNVPAEQAAEVWRGAPREARVAVVVNLPLTRLQSIIECAQPGVVQLHGDEEGDAVSAVASACGLPVWKAVHVEDESAAARKIVAAQHCGCAAVVLDASIRTGDGRKYGGTGETIDWELAARLTADSPLPVWLAGGLSPCNVGRAVTAVRPCGVDVVSGVEARPGRKDPERVRDFITRLRAAARQVDG